MREEARALLLLSFLCSTYSSDQALFPFFHPSSSFFFTSFPFFPLHRTRNQGPRISELILRRAPCGRGSPQGPQDERQAPYSTENSLSAKLTPEKRNGRFLGHRWPDDLVSSSPSALEAARAGSPSPGSTWRKPRERQPIFPVPDTSATSAA